MSDNDNPFRVGVRRAAARPVTAAPAPVGHIADVLVQFVAQAPTEPAFIGNALQLQRTLHRFLDGPDPVRRYGVIVADQRPRWLRTPRSLANAIRRMLPKLEAAGVKITYLEREPLRRPFIVEKIVFPVAEASGNRESERNG